MFSTAIRRNPSATSSAGLPISAAIAANFARAAAASSGRSPSGPKIAGKNSGRSRPVSTFASVTASGPPRP